MISVGFSIVNDFTQKELVLIGCWSGTRYLEVGVEQAINEGTIALSHKIQNMIVNYSTCNHESDGEDYRYQCSYHYKCKKCGEFYR